MIVFFGLMRYFVIPKQIVGVKLFNSPANRQVASAALRNLRCCLQVTVTGRLSSYDHWLWTLSALWHYTPRARDKKMCDMKY